MMIEDRAEHDDFTVYLYQSGHVQISRDAGPYHLLDNREAAAICQILNKNDNDV